MPSRWPPTDRTLSVDWTSAVLEHVDTPDMADFARWLKPGDVVSLRGEGLGETRQVVVPGADVIPLRRLA